MRPMMQPSDSDKWKNHEQIYLYIDSKRDPDFQQSQWHRIINNTKLYCIFWVIINVSVSFQKDIFLGLLTLAQRVITPQLSCCVAWIHYPSISPVRTSVKVSGFCCIWRQKRAFPHAPIRSSHFIFRTIEVLRRWISSFASFSTASSIYCFVAHSLLHPFVSAFTVTVLLTKLGERRNSIAQLFISRKLLW